MRPIAFKMFYFLLVLICLIVQGQKLENSQNLVSLRSFGLEKGRTLIWPWLVRTHFAGPCSIIPLMGSNALGVGIFPRGFKK